MASRESTKTVPVGSNIPNKRERAASQYGQLDDVESTDWTGDPESLKEAIQNYTQEHYGRKPGLGNITVTVGAKQALYNLLQIMLPIF